MFTAVVFNTRGKVCPPKWGLCGKLNYNGIYTTTSSVMRPILIYPCTAIENISELDIWSKASFIAIIIILNCCCCWRYYYYYYYRGGKSCWFQTSCLPLIIWDSSKYYSLVHSTSYRKKAWHMTSHLFRSLRS